MPLLPKTKKTVMLDPPQKYYKGPLKMTKKYYLFGIDPEPNWKKPTKIVREDRQIIGFFETCDTYLAYKKVTAFFRNNQNDSEIMGVSRKREGNKILFHSKVKFSDTQIKKIESLLDPLENYLIPIRILTLDEGIRVDSLMTPLKKAIVHEDIVVSSKNRMIFIGFRKNSSVIESDEILSLIHKATAHYHPDNDKRFISQQDSEKMAAFKAAIDVESPLNQPQYSCYSILVSVVSELKKSTAESLKNKNFYFYEGAEKTRFRYLKQKKGPLFDTFTEFYFSIPPNEDNLKEIKEIFHEEEVEYLTIEWKHHYFIPNSNKKIQTKVSNAIKGDPLRGVFNQRTIEGNLEITANIDSLPKEEFIRKIEDFLTNEKKVEFRPHKEICLTKKDISIVSGSEVNKTVFQIDLKNKKDACSEMEKKRIKQLRKNNNVLKISRKDSHIFIETRYESFTKKEMLSIFSEADKTLKNDKIFSFSTIDDARNFCHGLIDFNRRNDELPTFITEIKKRLVYVEYCKEGEISAEDLRELHKYADRYAGEEETQDNLDASALLSPKNELCKDDLLESNTPQKKLSESLNPSLQAIIDRGLLKCPKKRKDMESESNIREPVNKNQKISDNSEEEKVMTHLKKQPMN